VQITLAAVAFLRHKGSYNGGRVAGMTMNRVLTIQLCCFMATLGGCDTEDEAGELEMRDWGDWSYCPPRTCGVNSAEVNARSIRELNLDGVANSDGMRIVGFLAPQGILGNYQLGVENDELVARSGSKVLRGSGLVGATILVKAPGLLSLPVPILVLGHDEVEPWAEGADPVDTYALVYPDLSALLGSRNVCNGDLTDLLATTASVLGGETYDLATKTVHADQSRWFTIACPGSAADKLRMFGYGPQSNFAGTGHPATPAQRQATLKMVTADYCGGGTSYTENGTYIQWDNAAGTVVMEGELGEVEAVWTSSGAVCLGSTRIEDTVVGCNLPSCAGHTLAEGEWITHVPPL